MLYASLVGASALAAGFLSFYGTVELLTSAGERRTLEAMAVGAASGLAALHLLRPFMWRLYRELAPAALPGVGSSGLPR